MQLFSDTYAKIASQAKQLADKYANGRMLCVLEGGYDLKALEESVAQTTFALSDAIDGAPEHERPSSLPAEPDVTSVIQQAKAIHLQNG